MLLDDNFLRSAIGMSHNPRGGQQLILLEILAAFRAQRCSRIWLPYSLGPLASVAKRFGFEVNEAEMIDESWHPDALYFGTPTIVDGKKLFPESHPEEWDAAKEKLAVASLCDIADQIGIRCIVSGLGTGDISLNERIASMMLPSARRWTIPQVVCTKRFGEFTDWVILTFKETNETAQPQASSGIVERGDRLHGSASVPA